VTVAARSPFVRRRKKVPKSFLIVGATAAPNCALEPPSSVSEPRPLATHLFRRNARSNAVVLLSGTDGPTVSASRIGSILFVSLPFQGACVQAERQRRSGGVAHACVLCLGGQDAARRNCRAGWLALIGRGRGQ